MSDLSSGIFLSQSKEEFYLYGKYPKYEEKTFNADIKYINKSITPPVNCLPWTNFCDNRYIRLRRQVTIEDVRKQKLELMPGFKFTWYYSGMDVKSHVLNDYNDEVKLKIWYAFVRNVAKYFI